VTQGDIQMKAFLRKYELFQELSPSEMNALARVSGLKHVKKGEYVCHEGTKAASFYLIHDGMVKVVKHTNFGKDVILDIYIAGEMFLLEPIFDNELYPASAVAVEDTTILTMDRRKLVRYMDQNPKMMRLALKEMAGRVRRLNSQIKDLMVGKVDYRIANIMLKLSDKIGKEDVEGSIKIDISLSRQDIADLSGTTIETAIRTMSKFAKKDIMKASRNSIKIMDRDKLVDIAEGL